MTCAYETRTALYTTVEHAAAMALSVAATSTSDPVRAQSARRLYPLIDHSAAGDGGLARRRASALTALIADVSSSAPADDPRRGLVLAAEQWMLHPMPETGATLLHAARHTALSPCTTPEMVERAWLVGPGIELALAGMRTRGLDGELSAPFLSLTRAAAEHVVPMVWVAHQIGVPRDRLYRCIRAVDQQQWRSLLP
ncbi:hypothetical protein ACT17_06445 [Mycolicibacterium conceptionense]|uniref:Uncharacterized protein n=1 Tax=Mycolicibacterium conceptionense TaxID=451644 RepID=A0A0J8UEF9_9MYCO|nr:hypothetical protein [Mycolicibacterium conceptionense]KMV19671.1 hypothetical protein ACT17_06445 [Mycolicibacterium conceptionense]